MRQLQHSSSEQTSSNLELRDRNLLHSGQNLDPPRRQTEAHHASGELNHLSGEINSDGQSMKQSEQNIMRQTSEQSNIAGEHVTGREQTNNVA